MGDLLTVDGLPLHPLVVHAVVVLVPLAALGAVFVAVRPVWRRRFGVPVVVLAVAGLVSTIVAMRSGEQLESRLANLNNPLIAEHTAIGDGLLPFAAGFTVLLVALVIGGRLADRRADAGTPLTQWRVLGAVLAVLVVVGGVASTVQVVRIGHSGATAVWDGVGTS